MYESEQNKNKNIISCTADTMGGKSTYTAAAAVAANGGTCNGRGSILLRYACRMSKLSSWASYNVEPIDKFTGEGRWQRHKIQCKIFTMILDTVCTFQLHVLCFTVNALLTSLDPLLKCGDLDTSIPQLVEVSL